MPEESTRYEALLVEDWGDVWDDLPAAPPLVYAKETAMTTSYARHGDPDYASRTAKGCEDAGEPVFLLRAQDHFAPRLLRAWALWVNHGNSELACAARRIADAMEAWPHRKLPD